ncbi:MAG: DDE-type integrase/transposase/recombinase [Planctomycetota bacterium]|jgi:transposase InsO family protein
MEKDKREEIALFRYGVILPFLNVDELQWGMKGEMLRRLANEHHDIPHSSKHTIDEETIRKWLAAYQVKGFDGLKPKSRSDAGKPRAIPHQAWEKACALKREAPARSVRKIIQIMEAHNIIQPGQIKASTLSRHFKEHGLDRKSLKADPQVFRRFEAERPNQIWQSDIMYGPYLPDPQQPERNKRTYLVAFIDDFSRLIPDAEFYWDEKFPALENTFKKAMLRRGLPELVYVDNGKVYSARRLDAVCAAIGIRKINSKPYRPEGRGKVERFFRTVREDFLAEPEVTQTETLAQLNRLFRAWLEIDYHKRPHTSTGEPPLERWQYYIGNLLKTVGENELTELFLWQVSRTVSKVGLLSVQGVDFEVDASLKGKRVEVRFNPFDLSSVNIYYKEQFFGKARPATLSRWNTASRKRRLAQPEQPKPTGIKPLHKMAENHHQAKQQRARELTGSTSTSQPQKNALTLPKFIHLVADALAKKPKQLHPKELQAMQTFFAEHQPLTAECAALAMGKAITKFGPKQHIECYLEAIKTFYFKRQKRENNHEQ